MKPDRMNNWLRKVPAKATMLHLHWCALHENTLVCSWEREQIESDSNAGESVVNAAIEHCDDLGASASYVATWVGEDGVTLMTKTMGFRPSKREDELPIGAGAVEAATVQGIVGQALRHNEAMARLYVGSMSGVLGKMHDLLTLQAQEIKSLSQKLRARPGPGETEESPESVARAEAIVKVGDALANHLVPFLAHKMNGSGAPSSE